MGYEVQHLGKLCTNSKLCIYLAILCVTRMLLYKVKVLFLINWSYSSPSTLHCVGYVNKVWEFRTILSLHMPLRCPFLDRYLIVHHLNIDVCLRWVIETWSLDLLTCWVFSCMKCMDINVLLDKEREDRKMVKAWCIATSGTGPKLDQSHCFTCRTLGLMPVGFGYTWHGM